MRLIVGGVLFETSIETLCADPNSMLAAMFSGRHNVMKDDEGRYFIDRDGTHFRYILNYLRDGNTYIPFDNQQLVDELYEEVQFFNIENLLHKLDAERSSGAKKIDYFKLLELINTATKPLQMPGLKLSSCPLSYLNLDKANMRGCDFSSVQGIEVSFQSANLQNCNFNEALLRSANFRDAHVSKSTFIGTNMMYADMLRIVAKDCSFVRARLSNADLREGDFENSNFNEASMFSVNLERASLHLCTMTDANLERANISNLRSAPDRGNANPGAGGGVAGADN